MRKWEKRALVWGIALLAAGFVISAALLAASEFNLESFLAAVSDDVYVSKVYKPGESFSRIEITEASADVLVLPAEDNACSVSCDETDAIIYDVQVLDDTLHISRKAASAPGIRWIQVNMHEPKITLQLPEDSYESMKLNCISSDIAIEDLEIGKLEIESTSGDMNLHRLKMNSAELKTISGDISIQDSTAKDKISIDSTSGDVKMENCDADLFRTLTTSGDIEALLQTGKACTIETVSGSICLPEDIPELGSFHAETVSGDVHVRVK